MCRSMVDIQSPTAEIRRGKKKKKKERNYRMKIYMVSLLHRATIKNESKHNEMGPVRQNPIQRTVRSVHRCMQFSVHNCCTQYCTEQT